MQVTGLAEYFFEVVDRSGVVRERVSLDAEPLIIGRSYTCPVVIDDPYVCPEHLKVSLVDGELLVEDQGSLNGLSVVKHGAKESCITLKPGEDCYIGWTNIRFHNRNEAVSPARRDHSRQAVFSYLQNPKVKGLIHVFTVASLLLFAWLEEAQEIEPHKLFVVPATIYVLLLLWASIWSVIGKLLVHRALFFMHLAIAAAMFSISMIVESISLYSVFMLDKDEVLNIIMAVSGFIFVIAALYLHLHFASKVRPKVQMVIAIFISVLLTSTTVYTQYEAKNIFSSNPGYTVTLKPPLFVLGSAPSTEEFYSEIADIKKELIEIKKQGD